MVFELWDAGSRFNPLHAMVNDQRSLLSGPRRFFVVILDWIFCYVFIQTESGIEDCESLLLKVFVYRVYLRRVLLPWIVLGEFLVYVSIGGESIEDCEFWLLQVFV